VTEPTTPLIPENDNDVPESSSPWVMLISMFLLISLFILSSALLLQYAADKRGDAEGNGIDFAGFLKQGKAFTEGMRAKKEPGETPAEVQDSQGSESTTWNFFSGNGTVRWPKLKLTGFGTSTDDEEGGFAIINGTQVLLNTYIGDVKLVEIQAHGAVVEYKGEHKLLTVDHTR
jgi:hypothetical protein